MNIQQYVQNESEQGRFRGAVLVKQASATLVNQGFGEADCDSHRPNNGDTIFQIASISKQFTAAAILLLQEHGDLVVGDHICRWVPHCPAAWQPITLHHLLSHTSGIGHWNDYPEIDLFQPMERNGLIRAFQSRPILFSPGARMSYSSLGYVLLAYIIEEISGRPHREFLQEHIFEPLGMLNTGAGNRSPCTERQAQGYAGDEMLPSFELDTVGMGTGDIWSTAGDLALWDDALPGRRLLGQDSLASMFASHVPAPQHSRVIDGLHYGYGWFRGRLDGHRIIFHTGDNSGFKSFIARLSESDAVIVVLSNDEVSKPSEMGVHIARMIYG